MMPTARSTIQMTAAYRVWVRPSLLVGLLVLALMPVGLAWVQNAVFGLPYIAPSPASHEGAASGPHGFPFWIRWSHFFNMVFLFILIRSGLSILVDHPRLYLNDDCTPGSECVSSRDIREYGLIVQK